MAAQTDISKHYSHGSLMDAVQAGLASLGKTPDNVTADDLAPVDEFHVGGRKASEDFLDQLGFSRQMHILDVGCGLGGAARFAAIRYGSYVTGIDLTAEYVATGKAMSKWVGLEQRVFLQEGNALAMPFSDSGFDGAYMLHAGMNIADKDKLASEVSRVLKAGSLFGIYDIMRTAPGELAYPVPWAPMASLSAVAEPESYKNALLAAGFAITAERNRRDFALEFFTGLQAKAAPDGVPSHFGLHILMGKSTQDKVQNMIGNISKGLISPIELVARKL